MRSCKQIVMDPPFELLCSHCDLSWQWSALGLRDGRDCPPQSVTVVLVRPLTAKVRAQCTTLAVLHWNASLAGSYKASVSAKPNSRCTTPKLKRAPRNLQCQNLYELHQGLRPPLRFQRQCSHEGFNSLLQLPDTSHKQFQASTQTG